MKTNVKLLLVIALLVSACSTGSMVTSSSYTDDAYFTPGDHPPVTAGTVTTHQQPAKQSTTITGMRQEEAAKIVDNYYSDQKNDNLKSDTNTLGNEPADSGNTYQADEEAKDFIENYDEPEDVDYTTRIRTFYDPYAYDPYWDSYYSPGFGFGWGMGMGMGFGFGGFYGGFYSPFYGWGGYPYWGGGYYPYWGWGGYYGGGYHGGGYHGYGNNNNRYYGRQNPGGTGRSSAIGYSGASRGSAVGSTYSGGRSIGRAFSSANGSTSRGSNVINNGAAIGSTRQAGTRFTVNPNITKSANLSSTGQQGTTNAQTSINLRRGQVTTGQNTQSVRSGISANGGTRYTPTYSRPRTNIQSTYNNGAARQYSRPQSYSGTNGTSRSSISGSYQHGSSRAPVVSGSSVRSSGVSGTQSRSSSSGSYSAPSRSSSSGSSGGGGGGSRSFSGGGGGGGGGRRH